MTQRTDTRLQLISLAGPSPASLSLVPPGPLLIGRRSASALKLSGDDTVSREHARLEHRRSGDDDVWSLVDLGGKSGTWLNGTRLQVNQPVALRADDQIVIASWTFQLIDPDIVRGDAVTTEIVLSKPDVEMDQALTHVPEVTGTGMAGARLELLLKCSKEIHTATDEHVLAQAVVGAALEGTGFSNAALVRPLKPDGAIERLAGAG